MVLSYVKLISFHVCLYVCVLMWNPDRGSGEEWVGEGDG